MKTKIISRFLLTAFIALSAGYTLSGCSSSTTTMPPTTQSNVFPKTGSSYTYSEYQTDSLGNHVSGSDTIINATVLADGQTKLSQTNVYTLLDGKDTVNYTYSGNDALIYIENSGAAGLLASVGDTIFRRWVTLSIASHATGVVVLDSMDINVVVSSITIPAKVHMVSNYIGSDSVHLSSGEALFVQHCQIIATATSNFPLLINPAATLTNIRDIYFAPKIGYAEEEKTWTDIPSVLGKKGNKGGTVQVLTSYTLK